MTEPMNVYHVPHGHVDHDTEGRCDYHWHEERITELEAEVEQLITKLADACVECEMWKTKVATDFLNELFSEPDSLEAAGGEGK